MRTGSTTYFQHASCVKNALPVNYINVKHIKPHVVLHIGTENLIARSIFFLAALFIFTHPFDPILPFRAVGFFFFHQVDICIDHDHFTRPKRYQLIIRI